MPRGMRLRSNKACGNKNIATIATCLEQQSRVASSQVMPRGMPSVGAERHVCPQKHPQKQYHCKKQGRTDVFALTYMPSFDAILAQIFRAFFTPGSCASFHVLHSIFGITHIQIYFSHTLYYIYHLRVRFTKNCQIN